MVSETHQMIGRVRNARNAIAELDQWAGKNLAEPEELHLRARHLKKALTTIEESLIQTRSESHQDPINYPVKLNTQMGYLYSVTHQQVGRPTQAAYDRMFAVDECMHNLG